MKNYTIGRVYSCTSPNGCIVHTKWGYPVASVPAEGSRLFVAIDDELLVSDPDAIVREVKNGKSLLLGELHSPMGLPAGYKRVEYLESTGEQVIDTQLVPTINTGFACEIKLNSQPDKDVYLCGTQNSSGAPMYWISCDNGASALQAKINTFRFVIAARDNGVENRYKVDFNFKNSKTASKGDGIKVDIITGECTFLWHFTLFKATYRSNQTFDPSHPMRIYSWTHSEDDKIVRNYIPALDKTGAPCMYDTVSRTTFYNIGTGDFLYPGSESSTYSLRQQFPDWGKLTERGLRRLYHVPEGYTGDPYDYAIENGFKHIVETEQPSEGYWTPRWTETDDEIVLVWDEAEPPVEDIPVESEQEPVQ